jgi:acetolactate synthase-1/2/3 large subunit
MAKRTGAQIVWEVLTREGVEVVFGYPGGCNLPIYDAMQHYNVRHVLVRHEQNAGHAADGYARATGKVGVAFGTSGPGATNLVTAIATSMLDSTPTVFITGQIPTGLIGSDGFQETDVTGVTLPITKHNYLVTRVEDIGPTIQEAFHIARSGRPGPVLVDIPKDIQNKTTDWEWIDGDLRRMSERQAPVRSQESLFAEALRLIEQAERPLILAGQGILHSGAVQEVREFAERAQIPVALTLLGLDAMPEGHPLRLAMMGMHGEAYVNTAIQSADLLLAFGMRFDDRVTGKLETYARNAKKIHIDIDAAELNKNVRVEVPILSDLKAALQKLLPKLKTKQHDEWIKQLQDLKKESDSRDIIHQPANGKLWAAHVIHDLWTETKGESIVSTDVGQHQMWVAQYYKPRRARQIIWSGGLGTMGFGVPSAMGAKLARPDQEVWTVAGDGGFQMSIPELATLQQDKIGIKIAIINNGYLGMVRQWQELFHAKNYAATPLLSPDFVKLAGAYDIPAFRVTTREEVIPTIRKAREIEGPVLVEFRVEREDMVYPMVPAGTDLGQMIRRPVFNESF